MPPVTVNDPVGCRMRGDIEVQNPATTVFDYEEAVEQPESDGGHREEVKGNG